MEIQLDRIFKAKRKGYTPSIDVVAVILGRCWQKPHKTADIFTKSLKEKIPKGSSYGNVSEALAHLDNRGAGIIRNDPVNPENFSLRIRHSIVDFEVVVDFLFAYCTRSEGEEDEKQKPLLMRQIMKNRKETGRYFLSRFASKGVLEYIHFPPITTRLKAHPEIFLYLLLRSDLASMRSFGSSIDKRHLTTAEEDTKEKEEEFLKEVYTEQFEFLEYEKKEIFQREKKERVANETRIVDEKFYANLMSSFKATIITNYEKKDKSIRDCFKALTGLFSV
ncbi:MAG: hypothetical protein ACXADY_22670 [Candidatus Hodarchaeales archaeon]|jgi:hypothetical protein